MSSFRALTVVLFAALLATAAAAGDVPSPLAVQNNVEPEAESEREIVLIHDLGSNADVWEEVVLHLERNFKVWSYEMSGHGTTEPVLNPSVDHEAELFAQYLNDNGIIYPTVVGHGIGGMVALRFTLDNPSWAHRLILIDSAPRQLSLPDEKAAAATRMATDYGRFVAERFVQMSPSEDVTDRILDTALRTDSATYISMMMSTMDFDVTGELDGLSVPLLVMGSEMMFPSHTESQPILYAIGFGHARTLSFKRISLSGHFVMLEKPVHTASVLTAFGVSAEHVFDQ